MTQTVSLDVQAVIEQLRRLEIEPSAGPVDALDTADTARQWLEAISKNQAFLASDAHPIIFVGSVGVGKSSLIAATANLFVGAPPSDRPSLKSASVLAIGSGRTTVCEVRIVASGNEGQIGLVVDPYSVGEMIEEIHIYAEEEWARHHQLSKRTIDDDSNPSAQEIQRVIRGMTGYVEYQETYNEGGIRRRRNVRPLDAVVATYSTALDFAFHLLERANLDARTATEWNWSLCTDANLKELKDRFESINQGSEPTAMLPRSMTVMVPEPLPGSDAGVNATLIDTRGLDGTIESRADLQEFLRDPRAVILLCTSFKDAPGEAMRALLRSMEGDIELRQAISRTLLVLLDQGDAEQVNGAGGDRGFGQELKIDECHISLDGSSFSRVIEKSQILAFDVLNDDRQFLVDAINKSIQRLRLAATVSLAKQAEEAFRFVNNVNDELRPALREAVDQSLRDAMARLVPVDTPLRDPLAGLYGAIQGSRYASVIYATCRRRGAYSRLDLYAAIEAEASRAATEWLDSLFNAINHCLDRLEVDPALSLVRDHISLRRGQYQDAQVKVIRNYASRVGEQVRNTLKSDTVWEQCRDEWGHGGGFKVKVMAHLDAWSRRQQGLTAHERTDAFTEIPLLGEVLRHAESPQFVLYVRNLRGLKLVEWSPGPLALLIGANGAGKTTLFQTLRLLRVAYERGLAEAVTLVLGGSGNLKSWGVSDSETVEIGLRIGEAHWTIQLAARDGSVDHLTAEQLMEQDRVIYARDSLGAFIYGAERLEATTQLGLRSLMDRGAHEPAIRTVASFIRKISVYHDPDIWALRWNGSNTSDDRALQPRGGNALALLRSWSQERSNRQRYHFVLEGLAAAFPLIVEDMDFVEAGNTLVARIFRPGVEAPSPLASEANGVLQLLILLCDVAAAESESVVAIDEPENCLHPYALRAFLKRTTRWAKRNNLTVLLATHSIVLLDELTGAPEQIYVMKSNENEDVMPTRLDRLCNVEWLQRFKLGDLYEQGEIGSNEDDV